MLAELQPEKAFNGKGASQGPEFVMIDDSSNERGAFKEFWPDTTMLMCTFHFLQCRWTWLQIFFTSKCTDYVCSCKILGI